ncbi:putative beta-glucosidase 41 [Magnolia sinica]|uniref:putative beta-glucosidase 41 n=1 Tax=Magnolia sinica TaxID=86752 RepID=UPI002659417F|nr:putative beta-glucosidase 41 [Magnolia sinica]
MLEWFRSSDERRGRRRGEEARMFSFGRESFGEKIELGYLDPVVFGDPSSVKKLVGNRLTVFTEQESNDIKGSSDFIGMNHYITMYVMDNSTAVPAPPMDGPTQDEPDSPEVQDTFAITTSEKDGVVIGPSEGGVSYWRSYPFGIKLLLDYIKVKYENPPVSITEIGADIRGYLLCSYIDNFEWDSGYSFRLGLYHVNYTNNDLQRFPKASATWFREAMNTDLMSVARKSAY